MVVPLPDEDETPDEEDSPEEDDDPDEDDFDEDAFEDDEDALEDDEVPVDLPAGDADDEVPAVLDDAALTVVDAWAKVAPMPAAAAADSRLTCQVIFLTRRRPRSLD